MNTAANIIGLELEVDLTAIQSSSRTTADTRTSATTQQNQEGHTSADYNYTTQHGRRYHQFGENAYWLPNDTQEINRLDLQHNTWRLTFSGALYLPPLSDLSSAVDIGTGTGSWAIDLARENPNCNVLGTDLSPIQPTKDVPSNCKFSIANAEDPWEGVLGTRTFDFVHSRMLLYGMHDWPAYFKQAWKHCAPGGWVQVIEPLFPLEFMPGHTSSESKPLYKWSALCQEGAGKVGIDTQVGLILPSLMKQQGFVDIQMRDVMWPIGEWAKGEEEKTIGRLVKENMGYFVEGLAKLMWTKNLGWTEEQVDEFMVDVRKDLADERNTYYFTMCVVWGRKAY